MNPVVEEMNYLMHIGMPRRSGRYPWGSGEDPYQHSIDFLGRVEDMRKRKFSYTDENGKTWTGDTAIAKSLGMSTTEFRAELGIASSERRMYQVATAKSLRADGKGFTEIGRDMGLPESTVRSLLNEKSEKKMNQAQATADFLKQRLKEVEKNGGMLDVGKDVELELNVSKQKLDQALKLLKEEGYEVYNGRFEQANNPGNWTTQKVLCVPDTEYKEIYNLDKISTVKEYITRDGGENYEKKFHYPESLDSKRIQIRYNEDGGLEKDGIVELRRNVPDLSLGNDRYSQVRILVDGTHYIKGMAVYSDKMPDGVDVIFNTNKKKGTPMEKVLKEIKSDPDNPFGSAIKDVEQGGQYWYDPKTGERCSANTKGAKLGLINKRAAEGDWTDWKDTLPSQFLGKQSLYMAKKQLNLAKADKLAEYDEICSLTNPTIKKHLLEKFSDECDAAAVHLKAAALPGQKYHVIVPVNSLKDTEVYAPRYEDGTKLALIRYPHGGTFEIPILTVNNKHAAAKKLLGTDATDAVGITSKVAERLSGADFDGDTVMCIPTHDSAGKVKIKNRDPLKGLEGFDPKTKYAADKVVKDDDGTEHYYQNGIEYRRMTKKGTQTQMGIISNLITDMTLAGANDTELAAAVRHSMVVIDAEKHKLNYKQSEVDNNIAALHEKYQGKKTGGAATILSRAKGEYSVEKRQGSPRINMPDDDMYDPSKPIGSLIYKKADDLYYPDRSYNKDTGTVTIRTASGKKITYDASDKEASAKYDPVEVKDPKTGKVVGYTNKAGDITYRTKTRTQQSTRMAETDDAYTLVSDARHPMEEAYADYANSMKALANQARKTLYTTGKINHSASAKDTYRDEVQDLMNQLKKAEINTPRERAAQRMARNEVNKKLASGQIEKSDVKKTATRALSKYRTELGSVARKNREINISDRQWEAIQAGAISESVLKRILNNTNIDKLKERAMPRTTTQLSEAKINRIKAYSNSNYTLSQIATKMGVSETTVAKYLKGVK